MAKDVVVGFVGLGTMGGKMTTNILKADYKVVVHYLHRQAASHHNRSVTALFRPFPGNCGWRTENNPENDLWGGK